MRPRTLLVLASLVAAGGCAGDIGKMITTDPATRDHVMSVIRSNPELAGQMTDRLLGSDTTQALVVDKLMANGAAVQSVLARVARDPTMVDGVINFAIQDSAMRTHVLTLVKGLQMGAAMPR